MIVIGYQGIGKSSLAGRHGCVDLESTNFYVNGKKPDDWFVMYCNVALDLSRQGFIVFTSSHQPVRDWLGTHNDTDEKICICHPAISLMDKWIDRLQERYFLDGSNKNLRALSNAQKRYADNIGEMVADAEKYGFTDIEIPSMDYSLFNLVMNEGSSLHCNMCGKDVLKDRNDYFMLKDEIWDAICDNDYVSPDHVLCRGCCERLLGRRLTMDDLNDAPLNDKVNW